MLAQRFARVCVRAQGNKFSVTPLVRRFASRHEEEEGREKDFVARQERDRLLKQLNEVNKKIDPSKQTAEDIDKIPGLTKEQRDLLKKHAKK